MPSTLFQPLLLNFPPFLLAETWKIKTDDASDLPFDGFDLVPFGFALSERLSVACCKQFTPIAEIAPPSITQALAASLGEESGLPFDF